MEQISEAVAKQAGGVRLDKTKKSKAPLVAALLLAVLLGGGYLGLCAWATFSDTIWRGAVLLGQDVGNLTVAEAAGKLEAAFPEMEIGLYLYEEGQLACEHDGPPDGTVSVTALGAVLDANRLAAGAYQMTRGDFLTSGWEYLRTFLYHGTDFYNQGSVQTDDALTAQAAKEQAAALSQAALHTSYALEPDALSITKARDGRVVDAAALQDGLSRIQWSHDLALDVPYTVDRAKTLTAQEIHDEIAGDMHNAGYDITTDSIIPERVGVAFSVNAAQTALDAAHPGETVTISARIQTPEVTAEELESLLFRDLLGECSTLVTGTAARKSNVQLSAASINGYIMNPGDIFDYNTVVGKRTAERGYKPAPAYFQGETVDEIGGGICQTSSTLYLACLRSNLEIVERYAHRYVPAYIPWGMDATVSWGGPEYKFSNSTDYPIKIISSYENSYVTVQIYGTNIDGISVKMTNQVLSSTPWETIYEEDPTLPPGTEKVKTSAYTGYLVRTYQTIYDADGNVLDSHFEATSNYRARNKVILRAPNKAPVIEPAPEAPGPGTGEAAIPGSTPETVPQTQTPGTAPDTPVETPADKPNTPIIVIPDLPVADALAPLM